MCYDSNSSSSSRGCSPESKTARVGVVAAGSYGLGLICHLEVIERLETALVVDRSVDKAKRSLELAGVPSDCMAVVKTVAESERETAKGRRWVTDDISLVHQLPGLSSRDET